MSIEISVNHFIIKNTHSYIHVSYCMIIEYSILHVCTCNSTFYIEQRKQLKLKLLIVFTAISSPPSLSQYFLMPNYLKYSTTFTHIYCTNSVCSLVNIIHSILWPFGSVSQAFITGYRVPLVLLQCFHPSNNDPDRSWPRYHQWLSLVVA